VDTSPSERGQQSHPVRSALGWAFAVASGLVVLSAIIVVGDNTSRTTVGLLGAFALLLALLAFVAFDRADLARDYGPLLGLVIAIVPVISAITPKPVTHIAGSPICEVVDSDGSRSVTDTTDGYAAVTELNQGRGVVIRRKPAASSDYDIVGRLLPASCLTGFDGFCIGTPVTDLSAPTGPRDQLWFELPDDEGFVAGGVVQELAPGAIGRTPASDCPQGLEPKHIRISPVAKTLAGTVQLRFNAPSAITVGAAAYYTDSGGLPDWHQIAFDPDQSNGFTARWNTFSVPPQRKIEVVYAACWAGNVPSRAIGSFSVNIARPRSRPAEPPAGTPNRKLGASIACAVPEGGGGGA
jgi:hypothetical protein